jgi:hypothetical protein
MQHPNRACARLGNALPLEILFPVRRLGDELRKLAKDNLKAWVEKNQQTLGFEYQKATRMLAAYNRYGTFLRQRNCYASVTIARHK